MSSLAFSGLLFQYGLSLVLEVVAEVQPELKIMVGLHDMLRKQTNPKIFIIYLAKTSHSFGVRISSVYSASHRHYQCLIVIIIFHVASGQAQKSPTNLSPKTIMHAHVVSPTQLWFPPRFPDSKRSHDFGSFDR